MEDLFREADDPGRGLRLLEVRVEAREARNPAVPRDVLHPQVPRPGKLLISDLALTVSCIDFLPSQVRSVPLATDD